MTKELINETTAQPSELTTFLTIKNIQFEHHRLSLGIGEATPRLTWQVETEVAGWKQAGYEVELFNQAGELQDSTGLIRSDESVLVAWPFPALTSRQTVQIRLRVQGQDTNRSDWSDLFTVEAGLLDSSDWSASFVTPEWEEDTSRLNSCPLLRREFKLRPGILKARLYVTSLGLYEVYLNGARVGDQIMSPGWTSYNHRLRYQTYDVTTNLNEGGNAISAILADGWYRGRIGFEGGSRNIYGDKLALLAQLEIEYAGGLVEKVVTDANWRAATGPLLASGIYEGEIYDARLEKSGWAKASFNDSLWAEVRPVERNLTTLVAPQGPPVRRVELRSPVAILTSPSGKTLVDFGQNLVGRLQLTIQGKVGQTIVLRHAEVLENGELGTRPLREAAATDTYILRGEGIETWEPRFTFHGFRYAEVEGWPGELQPGDLQAVVCHSDMERTGTFECSDELLNRLHENVVWGMRGNFFDLPTDCPQRDERLGWTGDIQVFSPTASFLYDCAGFLASWLGDLAAEQKEEDGSVPVFVPKVPSKFTSVPLPAASWGDAAVIVPWVLYQRFGDAGILAAQFESMQAWVDKVARLAGESFLWDQGFQYGDWLDPAAPTDDPAAGQTPPSVVATAYFARSAELVGKAAGVLGRKSAESYYLNLARLVRTAFFRAYLTSEGKIAGDSVTAYSLGLEFELLPTEAGRQYAARRLSELVRESGYHISTGFVGTPLICDALCNVGDFEAAYRLLLQKECPSWLYSVTMGATTIWERWDSMLPDGSINPGDMTSFNHYALGTVADWLHRTVAGLASAAPGYARLEIKPQPGGGLNWARAAHFTPYGLAEVYWKIAGNNIELEVTVPPNSTAAVTIPGATKTPVEIGSGKYRWSYPYKGN